MSISKLKPVIYITNDDGISPDSAIILPLAQRLVNDGHDVVVCAPGRNNSACGMRITLSASNVLRRHIDFEKRFGSVKHYRQNGSTTADADNTNPRSRLGSLSVFSVDNGTPCDCIIVGIEPRQGLLARMGLQPRLVVSGINVGQNLGTDIYYSGTFSAARQAAIYGIPSVALSLNLFTRSPTANKHQLGIQTSLSAASAFVERALRALPTPLPDPGRFTIPYSIPEVSEDPPYSVALDPEQTIQARLEDAFSRGDFVFNVNIPTDWDGTFAATSLDSILYRSVIDLENVPSGNPGSADEISIFSFCGKRADQLQAPGSDVETLLRIRASTVSPVSTWPLSHALALPEQFFADAIREATTFWELIVAPDDDEEKVNMKLSAKQL